MQIDCEVVDMHLIQIKNRAIPQHLRTRGNNTQSTENSRTDTNYEKVKKKYKPYFLKTGSLKRLDNATLNFHKFS